LNWSHAYAVLALLALFPTSILLLRDKNIFKKILLPGLFFIPMHLLQEATGLLLNQWYFPGEYFALVPMPGTRTVPIEEFVIWIVLGSVAVLSYYELYIDDGK